MAGDDLIPFALKNVKGLEPGEQNGSGAYGAVMGMELHVALKQITTFWSPRFLHEKASIQHKFAPECASSGRGSLTLSTL